MLISRVQVSGAPLLSRSHWAEPLFATFVLHHELEYRDGDKAMRGYASICTAGNPPWVVTWMRLAAVGDHYMVLGDTQRANNKFTKGNYDIPNTFRYHP